MKIIYETSSKNYKLCTFVCLFVFKVWYVEKKIRKSVPYGLMKPYTQQDHRANVNTAPSWLNMETVALRPASPLGDDFESRWLNGVPRYNAIDDISNST